MFGALPVVAYQGGVALLSMFYLLFSALGNLTSQDINIINHEETKYSIVFNMKTNKDNIAVIVPKDNTKDGKVKIKINNKDNEVQFEFEHVSDIPEQYQEQIQEIFKSVADHVKTKPTLKKKIKNFIKNYVNKRL